MRQEGRSKGGIIGLCGRKHAGKDEVARAIMAHNPNYERVAFADPMKEMALAINPWIYVDPDEMAFLNAPFGYTRLADLITAMGWEQAKKIADVRVFLQRLGTEGGRDVLGEDVWVDRTFTRDVIPRLNNGRSVVVTDVRFKNEIRQVQMFGGRIWRVERPSLAEDESATGKHVSEVEWRSVKPDVVVVNDGSLTELHGKVFEHLRLSGRSILR